MTRRVTQLPATQFSEQIAAVAGHEGNDDDESETSVDDLLVDVLTRIEDYQPRPERHEHGKHKAQKAALKSKVNPYSIMKGSEQPADSDKKTTENMANDNRDASSVHRFEFRPAELLEDATLKQDWRHKYLLRDLVDDLDDKISQR